MKSTGIVRKIDNLGRIVLPIELRRIYDLGQEDPIEIFSEDGMIMLKKYEPACIFCGKAKDISVYKGKNICPDCCNDLKELKTVEE